MFDVSFNGVKDAPTYIAVGVTRGTDEGKVYKVSSNKTVSLCDAEDKFRGVIETIERDSCLGGIEYGYKTVSYSGSIPSVGEDVELVADGDGGVKLPATAGTGKMYPVVDVDTTAKTVTFKLLG